MRQQHRFCPLGEQVGNRRHEAADAGVIGDFAVFHRDVDIHAGQNGFGNNVTMYQGIVLYYVRLLEELKEQGTIMEQTLRDAYAVK